MAKYWVLMTTNQYVEAEGDDPHDAELNALWQFKNGDIEIDNSPIFICEECDLIEEEENA